MQHVRVAPINHRVAVRVRRAGVKNEHIIAVHAQRHRIRKRDERLRFFRRGWNRRVERRQRLVVAQIFPGVFMRHQRRAAFAEIFIPLHMVEMPMRVDEVLDRLF